MKEKIKYLIPILLIIIFMISIVPKSFQNDTFFTIAIGKDILETGVQTEEKLVWHEGLEFTNPRWLFDVIVATIYNNFNFLGIYIGVIVIACIQAILYYSIIEKIIQKTFFSLLVTLAVMYFSVGEFVARAQIMSFTLFLFEFYCIENLLKSNKKRYFIVLCLMPILLVNLHSSVFPMYFALYLPYIAEFILSKMKLRNSEDSKIVIESRNLKKIIILILIGIISGFIVPNSLEPYTYMFKNMSGISKVFIDELQNLNIIDDLFLLGMIMITIGIISFTKTKIRVTDIFYIVGFLFMSVFTVRCIYFFYTISTICIIRIVNDFFKECEININLKMQKVIYLLFFILFMSFCFKMFVRNLGEDYIETKYYPVDATEYILNNLDIPNIRIFNGFNFGSYLEFKDIPAFMDSRSEVYTEEFNKGTTILKDWYNVTFGITSYKKLFKDYEITHALLYNNEIINIYIQDDEEWELLYQDDNFSLYEKKEKTN